MSPIKVLVVGNGGHAKVVVGILRLMPGVELVGLVGPATSGGVLGLPLLGDDDDLATLRKTVPAAFPAIGDNRRRDAVFTELERLGFELPCAIHPTAVLDSSVSVGRGVALMAGVIVNADSNVGDAAILNTASTVDHDCTIGRAAHLAPGVNLSGYITVGDLALIGVGATVGRGKKLSIGRAAIVGAGSVVVTDVRDGITVVGVPARSLKDRVTGD